MLKTFRFFAISTLVLGLATTANAGLNVSTFEDVGLTKPDSFFNATPNLADPTTSSSGQFVSGGNSFNNTFTFFPASQFGPAFGVWEGWAMSNQTFAAQPPYVDQATTPDSNYQYMSVTGSGANGSSTYAVANTFGDNAIASHPATSFVNLAPGANPVSVQVTNTEYDFLSMKNGDGFAKQFGPNDFLTLTVQGYSGLNGAGTTVGNELDFSLASNGTILTNWATLDLSQFAGAESLAFGIESSDTGMFGVNTPAEFAMDNFTSISPSVVPEPSSFLLCLSGIGIGSLVLRRVRSRKGPL
jgi:Domain of unknown function (DUF4465)